MTFKRWVIGKPDRETAKMTATEIDKDPFVVMLAQLRGITDPSEVEYFLSNEIMISSPDELIDISMAADVINEHIDGGFKIAIFGDYDCDGVCASAILYRYLTSRGADVCVHIPDRMTDGYGMNTAAIDTISGLGCKLIITVDNGISCKEEIDYASSLGIVTVVTDHHIPPDELPDAPAVVDPNRKDCPSSFKQICGAQVAFKLICKLEEKEPEEIVDEYADLLSVAIVGDSMPLIGENRSIVKQGIRRLRANGNIGLSCMATVAGFDRTAIDSAKLSYGIVPRINAAGRMGSAKRAFDLLVAADATTALKLANEIEDDNSKRQQTEKEITDSAISIIEENGYQYDRVIVAAGNGFHIGVLGIAAIRICEKYGKPTIILSQDGEYLVGSCRSVEGFNIHDALKSCEGLLVRFGGHAMAAGLTLSKTNIDDFRKAINDYALGFPPFSPTVKLDFKLNPSSVSVDMVRAVKALEPFGNENPAPLFAILGVTVRNVSELSGGKHIKLLLERDGYTFNALLFGVSPDKFCFENGSKVDIAVALDLNTYRDRTSVSVIIRGIRPAGIDQDAVIEDSFAVDGFYSRGDVGGDRLAVTREDIAKAYKLMSVRPLPEDGLIYNLIPDIGYAKAVISLDILKELSLAESKDGRLYIKNTGKTDLLNSNTYRQLSKGGDNNG